MHYEYVEVKTEQNIFLNGFHAKEGHKSCVLFIPGLAGSFMESKFARELAQACIENKIDFLFAHNQGFFQRGVIHNIVDETDFKWKVGEENNEH